jgi:hypothetical protein
MATTPGRQPTNPFANWTIWPESEPGYFAELGRMIAAYASAEAGVHFLARYLSGLPDAKARAIFGRMRLPDLIELIRQMMRVDEKTDDVYQEVDACLVQLNVIANERNKLVHRMVEYAGSHFKVSNALTAKSLAAIEADAFSYRDLENMNIDCLAIFRRLLGAIAPEVLSQDAELNAALHAAAAALPSVIGGHLGMASLHDRRRRSFSPRGLYRHGAGRLRASADEVCVTLRWREVDSNWRSPVAKEVKPFREREPSWRQQKSVSKRWLIFRYRWFESTSLQR